MIPSFPRQLPIFGPTLYGELCLGLCRAFVAPWLDACRLPPPSQREPLADAGRVAAQAAADQPEAARGAPGATSRVIQVPAARWRQRRPSRAPG